MYSISEDNVAEWLRRLPAKQFPFGSVGSNPAVVVFYYVESFCRVYYIDYILYCVGNKIKKHGGAGYRSPCPSHAKRVLYHLSYTPIQSRRRSMCPVRISHIELRRIDKKIKNSPTGIRTPVFHVTGEDTNQLYYWRLLIKRQTKEAKAKVAGSSLG